MIVAKPCFQPLQITHPHRCLAVEAFEQANVIPVIFYSPAPGVEQPIIRRGVDACQFLSGAPIPADDAAAFIALRPAARLTLFEVSLAD